MEPSRDRPAFVPPQDGPTVFSNRPPVDLPDEFPGVVPQFRSRSGAGASAKLRPGDGAKGFGRGLPDTVWYGGFLCGVAATLGGIVCLALLAHSRGWFG